MSYEIGTATSAADLLNKLNTFLTAKGKAYGLSYVGTGNGVLTAWDGGASSVSETFTITATSATSFTVVGSVSGSIGPATVGTTFTHAKLTFLISAGGTAFVAGDAFKLNTCPPWVNQRNVAGSEMIWLAPGNDGLRQIYLGAQLFSNVGADYYNWYLSSFTGYASGNTFQTQAGFIPTGTPVVPLWNSTIPYWFVANGQRVVVVAHIGTAYMHAYLGLLNTYISPGQWPYPVFTGGSMAWATPPVATSTNWRYTYGGIEMHSYWRGYIWYSSVHTNCSGRIRLPDGTQMGVAGYTAAEVVRSGAPSSVWPYACDSNAAGSRGFQNIRENLDGSYPLLPIVFSADNAVTAGDTTNTWGELDGVKATTGHSNSSENTIKEGPLTYVVFQDTFRNEKDFFCAVALD